MIHCYIPFLCFLMAIIINKLTRIFYIFYRKQAVILLFCKYKGIYGFISIVVTWFIKSKLTC